jgi:hypothetical protein
MSTTTPLMGLVVPTPGETAGPTWASEIVDAFDEVDAHDHTTGKGTKVPSAGLNINQDLECNDQRLTEVRSVRFEATTGSLAGAAHARSLHASGTNLVWTTESGVEVAIISNGQMNPSAAGGIGGDYSGSAASWRYDAPNLRFEGYSNYSTLTHASLRVGPVKIVSESDGATFGPTIRVPQNLGHSYNLRLPIPPTSNTDVLTLDSSGVITGSRDISLTSVAATTVSGTNLVIGAQVRTDEGGIRHGVRTVNIGATECMANTDTANWVFTNLAGPGWSNVSGDDGDSVYVPLRLTVGDEVTQVSVYMGQQSATPLLSASLCRHNMLTGTTTVHGTVVTAASIGTQKLVLTGSGGTVSTNESMFVRVRSRAATAVSRDFYGAELKFKRD